MILVAAALLLPQTAPATAKEVTPEKELQLALVQGGIPANTAASLMDKLNRGELWESLQPGSIPERTSTNVVGNAEITTKEYRDGSRVISTIGGKASSSGGSAVQGVDSCSVNGRYRTGCRADVNLFITAMGFYFDYRTDRGGKITRYYGYYHHFVGGVMSNHRFDKFSDRRVRYSADYSLVFKGFPKGGTAWMEAHVSGDRAWTSNN